MNTSDLWDLYKNLAEVELLNILHPTVNNKSEITAVCMYLLKMHYMYSTYTSKKNNKNMSVLRAEQTALLGFGFATFIAHALIKSTLYVNKIQTVLSRKNAHLIFGFD